MITLNLVAFGISAMAQLLEIQAETDLVDLADIYCFQPDGDHRQTWTRAASNGFSPIPPEEFSGLSMPGAAGLRAFRKLDSGVEYRILTAANSQSGRDDGRSYFRRCWVSASRYDFGDANRNLRRELNGPHFRADNTYVYAWIPRPNGRNEFVPRRVYMRESLTLAREQGMRQATIRPYGDSVFIGYATPRDEATYQNFDWSGPEPVPAPK